MAARVVRISPAISEHSSFTVDLLAHDVFGFKHADSQGPDFHSNFVDQVVHAYLLGPEYK